MREGVLRRKETEKNRGMSGTRNESRSLHLRSIKEVTDLEDPDSVLT